VTLVGAGLVLAVAAIAVGIGLELGIGWGLAAGGLLSGALLLFVVDLPDTPDGGDA
jgi:membrane associated rhomboid family serine protease